MSRTTHDAPANVARALAGRYAVERALGRGGMATVYLAEERKHRRLVAIKVLHPDLAASVGTERFLREIGIAARLVHPHLLSLIDSGEADGLLYYVTPYISGGSLRDRLTREGRLPLADALRITEQVGAGLDFLHRAGFVHRDLKPENVLFADDQALLADFGIARATCTEHGSPVIAGPVTDAGVALGTPAYMSPEQAAGEPELGSQSDIYSLGCVLYEMLAGEPPFAGTGARETMARHATETPSLLRTRRAEVPPGVESAVARALAKDPAHRFSTVAAMLAELATAMRDPGLGSRRGRRSSRSIAVLPFVNTSSDAENEFLSDGITDELIDALSKIDGLRVASRTSVFALKGKPLDVRAIGALLGASVVLEGSVRRAGDRLRVTAQLTSTDDGRLLWSQRYDRRLDDVLAVEDELARTIATRLRASGIAGHTEPAAKRHSENVRAYGLYLRGRWAANKRTQEGVGEAIGYYEQAIAEDPRYALAYTGLSDAYALHVDYRSVPVAEGLGRAKEYARQALALDDSLAEAHASLAWVLFIYDWDWSAADREFRRAIELDPRYAPAHQWFAFLLAAHGRHDEALVEGHTAQELDPASVSVRRSLGWLYHYARRYDRARHHLTRAIEMNPMAVETFRVLALTLALEDRHEEAEQTAREALTLPGAGSYALATLAYVLGRAGRADEAAAARDELTSRATREYVSPAAIATAHLGVGDLDAALDATEQAHAERRGWLAYLRVNPIFDPLRGTERFERLVERMGLGF